MTTVAQFTIDYYQYLDSSGQLQTELPTYFQNSELLISLYRSMVLTRIFDDKAVRLQRTGQMGTFPSSLGQEATTVGTGSALASRDIYCPYYRDQGAMFCRGVNLIEVLSYWAGDERGSDFAIPREDLPISVPIGTQLLHAAGVAYAVKHKEQNRAVVTMCGDGGTSEGDFYEAVNLAGAWQLPLVFVINNNQWAISVNRKKQTGAQTLAQKAIAGGFEGIQVDGNDVLAVYDSVNQALQRVYNGKGPQLIEAITYRLSDHTTADDARRYCSSQDLEKAWEQEPIRRFQHFLKANDYWDDTQEQQLQQQCHQQVDQAIETLLNTEHQPPQAMFDFLYGNFPESLYAQYEAVWHLERTKVSS